VPTVADEFGEISGDVGRARQRSRPEACHRGKPGMASAFEKAAAAQRRPDAAPIFLVLQLSLRG
jgi:hypothetical protein